VLIRLAAAPSLTATAWRLAGSGLFYVMVHLIQTRRLPWHAMTRYEWLLAGGAAVALTFHFVTWIASLDHTSVVSSVVLVWTAPVWVALGSLMFLKEPPARLTWIGIAVALGGVVCIALSDQSTGGTSGNPHSLWGDFLALIGAWGMAAYFLIGRKLRQRYGTVQYVAAVYGGAGLISMVIVGATSVPMLGFETATLVYLGLLALVPQIIGHTMFNWAVRYVTATLATVAGLLSPIGATILAWIVLHEAPGAGQIVGSVVVFVGVLLAARGEKRVSRAPTDDE
jgi:drug/metabolite transporter (DMT)-like permease